MARRKKQEKQKRESKPDTKTEVQPDELTDSQDSLYRRRLAADREDRQAVEEVWNLD